MAVTSKCLFCPTLTPLPTANCQLQFLCHTHTCLWNSFRFLPYQLQRGYKLELTNRYQFSLSLSLTQRFIQLATVSLSQGPKVRTVVLRGWHENQILIHTDKRSQKVEEIKGNSNVEICW
jgi:hypothetical protein